MSDSQEYLDKKHFFNQLLTIYGRKPALEALQHPDIDAFRLHLADSNKRAAIIDELIELAERKGAEICYHSRQQLSRISKNAKQDQGVAIDLKPRGFSSFEQIFTNANPHGAAQYIALDNVTNPQNVGMIIRSVCAAPINGLILPQNGCAKLDSLVIKASAGTLFKAPIFRCDDLAQSLRQARDNDFEVLGLDVRAAIPIDQHKPERPTIYVLGNETCGLSTDVKATCSGNIYIPMCNGVESLNVAVTASLLAFRKSLG